MHEFTKKELEKLAWCVFQLDSKMGHCEPNYKELQNKIQFKIDNYIDMVKELEVAEQKV